MDEVNRCWIYCQSNSVGKDLWLKRDHCAQHEWAILTGSRAHIPSTDLECTENPCNPESKPAAEPRAKAGAVTRQKEKDRKQWIRFNVTNFLYNQADYATNFLSSSFFLILHTPFLNPQIKWAWSPAFLLVCIHKRTTPNLTLCNKVSNSISICGLCHKSLNRRTNCSTKRG